MKLYHKPSQWKDEWKVLQDYWYGRRRWVRKFLLVLLPCLGLPNGFQANWIPQVSAQTFVPNVWAVTIDAVEECFPHGFDKKDEPDFYAIVTIDGQRFETTPEPNRAHLKYPPDLEWWIFRTPNTVCPGPGNEACAVVITVEIRDKDGSSSDQADINPSPRSKDVRFAILPFTEKGCIARLENGEERPSASDRCDFWLWFAGEPGKHQTLVLVHVVGEE